MWGPRTLNADDDDDDGNLELPLLRNSWHGCMMLPEYCSKTMSDATLNIKC